MTLVMRAKFLLFNLQYHDLQYLVYKRNTPRSSATHYQECIHTHRKYRLYTSFFLCGNSLYSQRRNQLLLRYFL